MNIRERLEAYFISGLRSLIGLSRPAKLALVVAADAMLCIGSVIIAFSLRLGEWELWNLPIGLFALTCLCLWLPIFWYQGIYRSVVRFMGSRTMVGIVTSCFIMMMVLGLVFTLNSVAGVPRTISAIQPLIFAALLIISRLVARYLLFDLLNQRLFSGRRQQVLIYGAGSAGRQLAVSLRHEPHMILRGFIDDDKRLTGKHLDGVRIYDSNKIEQVIKHLNIDTVLLAMPRISRKRREQIVRRFAEIAVRVLTLPAVGDILGGTVSLQSMREIEVRDLLGRDQVQADDQLLRKTVSRQSVMITGAGGSIGSELCRQISKLNPARIILVEMTEHALYLIDSELRELQRQGLLCRDVEIRAELCNVAEVETVRRLFIRHKPATVFHAAAYKHVPLVEENVISGIRNNVFATLHCALHAERAGVRHFILVSTDKAVRPTNVMGASKRLCELVLQGLAARSTTTRFAIVRFGNVLGSSGSVVPKFQQQIREGGPVTLTHRDVVRYFMTIPEAAQLVIQAGGMTQGGEVFVLDMGEPVRIYDLARSMIHLSGLTVRDEQNPDGDIEICETGLRKGEKLYEELLIGESSQVTTHPQISQANEHFIPWHLLDAHLKALDEALCAGNRAKSLQLLCNVVPEFIGEQSFRRSTAA